MYIPGSLSSLTSIKIRYFRRRNRRSRGVVGMLSMLRCTITLTLGVCSTAQYAQTKSFALLTAFGPHQIR